MMRRVALLVGIGAVSSSFASFELALVLQSVTPANSSGFLAISRWDPINRVSLGYFGVPGFTDTVMALNPGAPGTVDTFGRVGSSLQIRRYDYGNGVLTSTINVGVSTAFVNDVNYLSGTSMLVAGRFGSSDAARIYSTTGSLLRNYANPTGTLEVLSAVQDTSGITFVLSRQAGSTTASKYTLSSYAVGSSAVANSTVVNDNTTLTSTNLTVSSGFVSVTGTSMSSRRVYQPSGTTIGSLITPGGWVVPTSAVAAGHGDIIHGFGYDSVGSRMALSTARVNSANGDSFQYIPTSLYATVYDSAIVVAPEPGTLVALGAGVGVLLRRRRKSSPR